MRNKGAATAQLPKDCINIVNSPQHAIQTFSVEDFSMDTRTSPNNHHRIQNFKSSLGKIQIDNLH